MGWGFGGERGIWRNARDAGGLDQKTRLTCGRLIVVWLAGILILKNQLSTFNHRGFYINMKISRSFWGNIKWEDLAPLGFHWGNNFDGCQVTSEDAASGGIDDPGTAEWPAILSNDLSSAPCLWEALPYFPHSLRWLTELFSNINSSLCVLPLTHWPAAQNHMWGHHSGWLSHQTELAPHRTIFHSLPYLQHLAQCLRNADANNNDDDNL